MSGEVHSWTLNPAAVISRRALTAPAMGGSDSVKPTDRKIDFTCQQAACGVRETEIGTTRMQLGETSSLYGSSKSSAMPQFLRVTAVVVSISCECKGE